MRGFRAGALAAGATLISTGASALTIQRNFVGGTAPGNAVGPGDLVSLFNAAADYWEAAILDSHTVTLNYRWAALSGGTLGVHSLTSQGGNPNRETVGSISFDSDGSSVFFMDGTPFDNIEYTNLAETNANLGGGVINVGRVYTGPTGAADGRTDLFSVVLHEIGHSLGMSSANTSFNAEIAANGSNQIIVDAPVPFAGTVIPTVSGAHINRSTTLLFPSIGNNVRRLISGADILANAEISRFTNLNLNPNPVPEPATVAVLSAGAAMMLRRRRKA